MEQEKIVVIPRYFGCREVALDGKNRLYLPAEFRNIMANRNAFNLYTGNFNIELAEEGIQQITYQGTPFAIIAENTERDGTVKESLAGELVDTRSIDDMLYLAPGTLREGRPLFTEEAKMVFAYSVTDAQKQLYGETRDEGFANLHRMTKMDQDGRLVFTDLERSIAFPEKRGLIKAQTEYDCLSFLPVSDG